VDNQHRRRVAAGFRGRLPPRATPSASESLAGVADPLRFAHAQRLGVIRVSDLRPNFRMRLLSRTLRGLREQCGLSQQEAGAKLRFSEKKMSRIEQGQVPGYHEFLAMLDLYGIIVSDYDD